MAFRHGAKLLFEEEIKWKLQAGTLLILLKSQHHLFSGVGLLKFEHFHLGQAEGNSFKIRE